MHCHVLDNFWPPMLEMEIRFSSQECSVPQRHYKYSLLPLDTALMQIIMTYNNTSKTSGQKLTFCPPKSVRLEKMSLCYPLNVPYWVSVLGSVFILCFQYLKLPHSFKKTLFEIISNVVRVENIFKWVCDKHMREYKYMSSAVNVIYYL